MNRAGQITNPAYWPGDRLYILRAYQRSRRCRQILTLVTIAAMLATIALMP